MTCPSKQQTITWTNDDLLHWYIYVTNPQWVNTFRLRQNDQHFPDRIFKCTFLNENVWILINIAMKFVPEVRINNIPALVQIKTWRRPGDKLLSEPMMVRLQTHICVTRPQWVKGKTELFAAPLSGHLFCDLSPTSYSFQWPSRQLGPTHEWLEYTEKNYLLSIPWKNTTQYNPGNSPSNADGVTDRRDTPII